MRPEREYKTTESERERAKRYREANPEKARAAVRAWRMANLERARESQRLRAADDREGARRRQRAYVERNREKVAERLRLYASENPERVADAKRRHKAKLLATAQGRLNSRISAQIRAALCRGGKGGQITQKLVGWSMADLMSHLERQFLKGMSWDNMGEWHIDHIVPLAHFARQEPFDVRAAWALTNLRPLWAKDNKSKGGRRGHLL